MFTTYKPLSPLQASTKLLASVMAINSSLAEFGIAPQQLVGQDNLVIASAYEASRYDGSDVASKLTGRTAKALRKLARYAADRSNIPGLATIVLDAWQRGQLVGASDQLGAVAMAAREAAASPVPAAPIVCDLLASLANVYTLLAITVNPLPVLLRRPPGDVCRLLYASPVELMALANELETMSRGLLQIPADAGAMQARAQQLRTIAVEPIEGPTTLAEPARRAVH